MSMMMAHERTAALTTGLSAVAVLMAAAVAMAGCSDDDTTPGGQGLTAGGSGGTGGAPGGSSTGGDGAGTTGGHGGGTPPGCGDGNPVDGEECDDGNLESHDGCSSGCTVEALSWDELLPTAIPTIRADHAMAYDAARDRHVFFGGFHGGLLQDTWEYDGAVWKKVMPTTTTPAGRFDHRLAFDPSGPQVIMYGGSTGGLGGLAETWSYDGLDWTLVDAASACGGRYQHGLVFDSNRNVIVAFGGTNAGVPLADTWEYASAAWTSPSPAASPPARFGLAMAFNPLSDRIVLFGGFDGSNAYADTWEYDSSSQSWVAITPTTVPPHRRFHHMVYDAGRDRVVMYGGFDGAKYLDDTWEYDGSDWVETSPSPAPYGGPMSYDTLREHVVMSDAPAGGPITKTWVYRLSSGWPEELCDGADGDTDGLTDCADPDCEGLPCAGGTCSGGVCQ